MSQSLAIRISTEGADAEELGELTADLRQTLANSGLADVAVAPVNSQANSTPTGERFDLASIGALLVSIASGAIAAALTELIQNWASDRRCSVHIRTAGGEELEINAHNRRDIERLISYMANSDNGANGQQ